MLKKPAGQSAQPDFFQRLPAYMAEARGVQKSAMHAVAVRLTYGTSTSVADQNQNQDQLHKQGLTFPRGEALN